MSTTIEILQASVPTYIARARQLRADLNRTTAQSHDELGLVIGDLRRQAAVEIGGAISNYLIGRRTPGKRVGRIAVDAGRHERRLKSIIDSRRLVLMLLSELESEINRGLEEPIDWKFQRHLLGRVAHAKSATRPTTMLDRIETILREISDYSPPLDDFTTIRRLERVFRELIRKGLSSTGSEWWVTRVPGQVRRRAEAARRAHGSGMSDPLMFLTFGDYGKIILADVNWESLFLPVLGERSKVESAISRLVVLRNDVAHSRPLPTTSRVELQGYLAYFLSLGA